MSQMMDQIARAQSPAAAISFDAQLRYFGATPKPLCWMPLPDVREWLNAGDGRQLLRELVSPAPPTLLPAP